MDVTRLGTTGLRVSRLCLGTMIFGSIVSEQDSMSVLDAAEGLGFEFIDVADVYPVPPGPESWGRTEEIVGRWMAASPGRRSRVVLATKFAARVGPGPNDAGGGRKHVIQACEASLRRLGTDRIDLYWMHHPDPESPIDETLEAIDRLFAEGKVLYAGASNFEAWRLGMALLAAGERRTARFSAVQPRMSLLDRRAERELIPLCQAAGLGVVPYNPLGAGMLTGKYRRGAQPPEGSRFSLGDYGRMYQERYWSEAAFDLVERLVAVATSEGVTPAQAALAWLLGRPGVTSPIVGASRPDHLSDDVAALDARLTAEARAQLDEASAPFS